MEQDLIASLYSEVVSKYPEPGTRTALFLVAAGYELRMVITHRSALNILDLGEDGESNVYTSLIEVRNHELAVDAASAA